MLISGQGPGGLIQCSDSKTPLFASVSSFHATAAEVEKEKEEEEEAEEEKENTS